MPEMKKIAKPKNFKKTLKIVLISLKKWRVLLILSLIFAVISVVLSVAMPKLLGEITTEAVASLGATGKIDFEPLSKIALALIILYIISAVFAYFENYICTLVAARYSAELRRRLIEKIARLPISYFDTHKHGDLLSIMSNDIDALASSLRDNLTTSISSLTTVVGILIMMISISLPMSLISVAIVPVSLFFVGKIAKKAQDYFVKQRKTLGALNSEIEEDYSGQLIIKSNSYEPTATANFSKVNNEYYETAWKAQFFSSIAFPITHLFTNFGYAATCLLGGYLAIRGELRLGDFQAFIQYVNQFNRPINEVAQIFPAIQQTLAAAERVFDFLNAPEEEPDPAQPKALKSVKGEVEFHDVSFSYDPEKPIIKHFSAKIPAGSNVAIVGPTGAGKTTIINLLMRFYDPTEGYITIDGVPTREMKRGDVRDLFGMVLQDTWLFSGSVEDNLRYGKTSATLPEIRAGAAAASIDHIIESFPAGYKTEISEDSDNVSAGEKQLLTIARVMVANPPMIILDEATSNVDTRTERQIQTAFEKLTHGRTSFVIAHRLSTIRNSDLILVMKDGNIVEQGRHDDLLKKNGFYAELYNSQFAEE
ncbi:ABC transporter ATP-binding protein [Candidatus Saccharibacteria bacterium]|nr:ABC transporter ATP-binding protein [Candidatus Saccharibacteria bacterium]